MLCCVEPSVFSSPGGAELIGIRMHIIKSLGPWEIRNVTSLTCRAQLYPANYFLFRCISSLFAFVGILR